jgi:hypothetical protein
MRISLTSSNYDDLKDNKFQELLIQEFRNYSEEIRHIESIIFQSLSLFFTIFLAYAAFLATAISDSIKYCDKHSYVCVNDQYKVANLFYFSKELIGIAVFAGFVVTLVCYAITLIMTKASQTKFINKNNRNNIRDTIYKNVQIKEYLDVCLQMQKLQNDWVSSNLLSIRRIAKIIPFAYILLLWIFTLCVVCQQFNTPVNYVETDFIYICNICIKRYIVYEYMVLLFELLFILLYLYFYAIVWENPISKRIKNCITNLVESFRKHQLVLFLSFSTSVIFFEYYRFFWLFIISDLYS